MSHFSLRTILTCCVALTVLCLNAQNKKQLEKKREDLNKKIAQTTKLLAETEKNQKEKKSRLVYINDQINLREELINTISGEIGSLDQTITDRNRIIEKKSAELRELKAQYARILRNIQLRGHRYDVMMFIFASKDFYQAFRRMKYLQQYTAFRKKQADLIETAQMSLGVEVRSLSDKKLEKNALLTAQEREKSKLAKDKQAQLNTLGQLKQEEKKLKAQLEKQQAEKKKVDRELEKLLNAEIKKSKTANKGTFRLAPEAKNLSENFEANKGRLPWPVERGTISSRFGKQPHPVLKNIIIDNTGIDITTDREAQVKAIFKGTVSNILIIPGAGKVVVLDHGAYRSIYTQLKEVYVQKGQQISNGQALGKCLPGEDGGKSEAHLEIWKIGQEGAIKLNPLNWIKN